MSLGDKITSAFRWEAGAKLAGQLFSWVMTIIVIRLLSPEDYGLMAMAVIFIEFLMLVNELGLSAVLVQRSDLDTDTERQIFGLVIIVNTVFFILMFSSAPLIASFFDEELLSLLIRILAFQFIISAFELIPLCHLYRNLDFKRKSIIYLGASILGGITTLLLAFAGFGVWSLIWGNMILVTLQAIGMNIISPFPYLPKFSMTGMRQIVTFGGLVTLERILWFLYTRSDVFVVGKVLGKDLLGIYSVAMHLASIVIQKTGGIIYGIAFPSFSRANEEPEKVARYFLKASRIMSFLTFPIFFGISSVASEIVLVLLGESWAKVGTVLAILSVVMPLQMMSNLLPPALQGIGRPDVSVSNLMVAVTVMPLSFLAGSHWGLIGVSIAWVIAYPIVFLVMVSRSVALLGITLRQFLATIILPLILSASMYGAVLGAKMALGSYEEMLQIIRLTILIMVGAGVYSSLALLLKRDAVKEVMELVRR